jgi:hypothetical protein
MGGKERTTMRVSKILGSLAAIGAFVVAVTATTESRAGDEEFVSVTCSNGALTASGKNGFHTNEKAPWKWDKGEKVSITHDAATFKGAACTGLLTAFVCNNDGSTCKGPIKITVH